MTGLMKVLWAVVRFVVTILALLVVLLLSYSYLEELAQDEFFRVVPFAKRDGHWYLVSLLWSVLTVSAIFAIVFDFPKFRPWIRLDKALLAGSITVLGPQMFIVLYDMTQPGLSARPLLLRGIVDFAGQPDLGTFFKPAFHAVIACYLCHFSWFFPNGPKLFPWGFLYRFGVVFVIMFPLYFFIWVQYVSPRGG